MEISISQIEKILKKENLLKEIRIGDNWLYQFPVEKYETKFLDLQSNSRTIKRDTNTLFFCKGLTFKQAYLQIAIDNGVKYYLADREYKIDDHQVTGIIVTDIKKAMALLAAEFYQHPEEKLTIVGITGTKGKTTTAYFLKHILDRTFHQKVALLSTIDTTLDGQNYFKSHLSTPVALDLFRMMNEAVENGMTHLVMEASSQAFKQSRVYGLRFNVGVFLNISPDHISPIEHATFDDYLFCKRQIISQSDVMVINQDSRYYSFLHQIIDEKNVPEITYGRQLSADYRIEQEARFSFVSQHLGQLPEFHLQLDGDFNKEDATAAMAVSQKLGASVEDCIRGIEETVVPGRMEQFELHQNIQIYVDYAHNFDSLNRLLNVVRNQHPDHTLWVVTGSTGKKGLNRRVGIGKAIGNFADYAVLTSDDPDTEDPNDIAKAIAGAINNPKVHVKYIEDRKSAIQFALQKAQTGDAVVVSGKGEDPYQKINGVDVPYDGDSVVIKKLIKALDNASNG